MRARWSAYAGVSVALAGGVVVKALAQRPNFYSAAVYLSQSSANLMILTNMIFVVACTLLLGLQKILYGPLRPIEIEQLYEKAWFAITETCLAMTIFRGEIGSWFLVMFFSLLAGKVWAWIGEGRVEILEQQPPRDPRLFHTRLALSLGLSVVFDLTMLEFVVREVMRMPKPDMMVMFGFEFAVLSIISLSTAARYAINLIEIGIVRKQKAQRVEDIKRERREAAVRQVLDRATAARSANSSALAENVIESRSEEATSLTAEALDAGFAAAQQPVDEAELEVEGWEGKGRWMFYLDLATDFFKLVVYLSFFFILLAFYGLPIHILRDVFLTCRSFVKRISDFIKYRNATRDMNERYPDATTQDFGSEDVCIICREEMRPYEPPAPGQPLNPITERMRPKKLPCGHVLHFSCLRSWLERQQICPTCRTSVVPVTQDGTGANGAGGVQGPAGQQQQGGGRGRGGVLRIGPLRIAVGAMRGNNIVNDLQQRLRDGEGQPAAAAAAPANNNAPQQFGFGIRWDGMRRRERRNHSHRTIQEQLQSLERQIQQEINSLGASMNDLLVLRNIDNQLALLRRQRQATTGVQQPSQPGSGTNNNAVASTQLVGDASARLTAGHPDLPAGMALPEGWTMTPLSPIQGRVPPFQAPIGGSNMTFVPNHPFAAFNRGIPTGVAFPGTLDTPETLQRTGHADGGIPSQQQSTSSQTSPNPTMATNPAEPRSLADAMAAIAESRAVQQDQMQQQSQREGPTSDLQATNRGRPESSTQPVEQGSTQPLTSTEEGHLPLSSANLPNWNAEATHPLQSTPMTDSSSLTNDNGSHPTAATSSSNTNGHHGGGESSAASQESSRVEARSNSQSQKDRNPTVEDLLEDLD